MSPVTAMHEKPTIQRRTKAFVRSQTWLPAMHDMIKTKATFHSFMNCRNAMLQYKYASFEQTTPRMNNALIIGKYLAIAPF